MTASLPPHKYDIRRGALPPAAGYAGAERFPAARPGNFIARDAEFVAINRKIQNGLGYREMRGGNPHLHSDPGQLSGKANHVVTDAAATVVMCPVIENTSVQESDPLFHTEKYERGSQAMSYEDTENGFRTPRNKLRNDEVRRALSIALIRHGGTCKEQARDFEKSPKSIDNYRNERCEPVATDFLNMARGMPELAQKVISWLQHEHPDDPRRLLSEFERFLAQRGK